jgi:hypothetical protein
LYLSLPVSRRPNKCRREVFALWFDAESSSACLNEEEMHHVLTVEWHVELIIPSWSFWLILTTNWASGVSSACVYPLYSSVDERMLLQAIKWEACMKTTECVVNAGRYLLVVLQLSSRRRYRFRLTYLCWRIYKAAITSWIELIFFLSFFTPTIIVRHIQK